MVQNFTSCPLIWGRSVLSPGAVSFIKERGGVKNIGTFFSGENKDP